MTVGSVVPADDMPDNVVPADDMPEDDGPAPEETAGRVGGLTLRAVAKGAAELPDAIVKMTNPLMALGQTLTGARDDTDGPRETDWSDVLHPERWGNDATHLMDHFHAPTPATRGERIYSAAAESLPSAILAPEARIPGAIAGAVGSAASEYAGEEGAGPVAQFALGALGAGATGRAAGMLRRPITSAVNRAKVALNPPKPPPKQYTAEEAIAKNAESGSMGAAQTAPDLEGVHPQVVKAIGDVATRTGGYLYQPALEATIDAGRLALPEESDAFFYRRGQALRQPQQRTDEKNFRPDPDTQGLLTDSIEKQEKQLGSSITETRRRANPDIVQRTNYLHDQTAINAIKKQDNELSIAKKATYQELADQNGGDLPIDSGVAVQGINADLKKRGLRLVVEDDPVLRDIHNTLSSGEPINFETFEHWRTRLAELQRGGDAKSAAATVFRNGLENLPLSTSADHLKGIANRARALAKRQFDLKDQNPAYKAAVEDNVPRLENGLHDLTQPSPLAGHFLERYATGDAETASPVHVQRLKQAVPDPELSSAIEAHGLNTLSEAAGINPATGVGNFTYARYRNRLQSIGEDKAKVLFSPDTNENLQRLERVAGRAYEESKADSTNRSNSTLALIRHGAVFPKSPTELQKLLAHAGDLGGDVLATAAAAKVGPLAITAKNAIKDKLHGMSEAKKIQSVKDAKLKFAQEATEPGAGLDYVPPTGPRPQRAAGGKVTDDMLARRLSHRWKAAKRATDATTEPLLNVPDNAIIRALDIAQEHL